MISKIFKLTGMLLLSVVSLSSCKSDDDAGKTGGVKTISISNNTETLNTFINYESVPTYKSSFKPSEETVYTTPSKNLTFTIHANSITKKDGGKVPEELTIVVREYLSLGDMLIGGVSTTSNNQILVTGGNFYWQIEDKDGNTDYEIANAQLQMNILTDLSNEYLNNMMYYEGSETEVDGVSVINWDTPDGGGVEFWAQREGEGNQVGDYNVFFIYGLGTGWVNCDYLSDYINEKGATQFKVKLKADDSYGIKASRVVMVSKTFPSVVYITSFGSDYYETYKESIPKGLEAKLIAIGENKDGKVFYGELDIQVKGDDIFEVELKPSTKEKIKKQLKEN